MPWLYTARQMILARAGLAGDATPLARATPSWFPPPAQATPSYCRCPRVARKTGSYKSAAGPMPEPRGRPLPLTGSMRYCSDGAASPWPSGWAAAISSSSCFS